MIYPVTEFGNHIPPAGKDGGLRWGGLAGMLGSVGWFTAMTIQNAAYVRALGQIELVFTFIAAQVVFRERSTRLELGGIVLIVAGILILLLG